VGSFLTGYWDGDNWRTREQQTTDVLADVSCTSARNCIAVGNRPDAYTPSGEPASGLISHWNGKRWSDDLFRHVNEFDLVSCSSDTACIAIGRDRRGLLAEQLG
jgi:hypothetical protein